MTQTLERPRITGWGDDPLIEDAIECSSVLKSKTDGSKNACPNVAAHDAIVTCDHDHEQLKHYCKRCFKQADTGNTACTVCLAEGTAREESIIRVLTAFDRNLA